MGFISIIVFMIGTGFIIQTWYRKVLREKWKDAKYFLGAIIIPTIWLVEFLVYIDVLPLPALVASVLPWVQPQSGRTWMWNSWQCWQFGGVQPLLDMPAGMSQVAIVLAASYPLWYFFGIWLGKCIFGNKTYQQGLSWLVQAEKGTARAPKLPPERDDRDP
jgi:hypothetical protein